MHVDRDPPFLGFGLLVATLVMLLAITEEAYVYCTLLPSLQPSVTVAPATVVAAPFGKGEVTPRFDTPWHSKAKPVPCLLIAISKRL